MRKIISISLAILLSMSVVALSGCDAFKIEEQPDAVVIYADKIYPEAVGNYLTDASVDVPTIEAYMEEYNKNADDTAKINYETIKYNKDADYYYVNDKETSVGIKFRLDDSMTIVSASIYTGSLDQTTKNVYNIVINAIETCGYKTLMTDEDKAVIQHTLNGFNGVNSAKNEVLQIFSGEENFAAKWENNIAEFEIPVQPSELPKPDTSHTLSEIVMPTIDIPSISLDTTIVEGTHLKDLPQASKEEIKSVITDIDSANSQIAGVKEYNKTTPEGVNKILDDIVVQSEKNNIYAKLESTEAKMEKMKESPTMSSLPSTTQLTKELEKSYADFAALTKVTASNPGSLYTSASAFFAATGGSSGSSGGNTAYEQQQSIINSAIKSFNTNSNKNAIKYDPPTQSEISSALGSAYSPPGNFGVDWNGDGRVSIMDTTTLQKNFNNGFKTQLHVGSSTHISSSGREHGGAGGSF